jgi:hypothetical protein
VGGRDGRCQFPRAYCRRFGVVLGRCMVPSVSSWILPSDPSHSEVHQGAHARPSGWHSSLQPPCAIGMHALAPLDVMSCV